MSKIRFRTRLALVAAIGLAVGGLASSPAFAGPAVADGSASDAANGGSSFVTFDAFMSGLSKASYQAYSTQRAVGAVRSAQAFDGMRSYALNAYRGVQVKHSYVADGSYVDCVVTETQPSVRAQGITKVATPPSADQVTVPANATFATQQPAGAKDAFGNAMACEAGTIPMQRISMARMTKYSSLGAFLAKQPTGKPATAAVGTSTITPGGPHRYAIGYQYVANYGGNSWLNLWNPSGEFSLSQQWFVNGSQTVEGGWVHYPAKFGNNAVLFIFYTPDNYATGCYNLECGAFVQTSSAFTLGGAWNNYSTPGGTQWGFSEQWQYWSGNWWLFIQGTAIGYYPGSVYNGGPLGSGNSTLAEWGGETYTGGTYWPQMGSGQWPSAGFGYAAYQDSVFYINRSYGGIYASLSPYQSNPSCYQISIASTFFYYGGPGGYC